MTKKRETVFIGAALSVAVAGYVGINASASSVPPAPQDPNVEALHATSPMAMSAASELEALQQAKQLGEIAPDFALTNASGKTVRLSDYLKDGPVVLTWYRGGWCPYCNLALNALQKELPNFKAAGATLLALTPELPDKSMSTAEKNELEFEVLSDIDNQVGKEYGVVYTLAEKVAKRYASKFDLGAYNGNDSNELPLAVTYIIAPDGRITYAFLDTDFRKRADPATITAELNK